MARRRMRRGGACLGRLSGFLRAGKVISGLNQLPDGGLAFHAGTAVQGDNIVTAGGRVITAAGRGANLAEARDLAYATARAISFEGAFYRRDIAERELR
ncbi:MAG: phosphoribosylglycinamide synthetase C domain-containing protein [Chloroflexota bacterium]